MSFKRNQYLMRRDYYSLKEFVPESYNSVDCTSVAELKGDEVSAFYDQIVSSNPVHEQKPVVILNRDQTSSSEFINHEPLIEKSFRLDRFFFYAQQGKTSAVKYCLQQGFQIDSKDEFGWTALMCASCSGAIETVKFLLDHKADQRIYDKAGKTAWRLATQNGHHEVAKLLQQSVKSRPPMEVKVKVEPTDPVEIDTATFCEPCQEFFEESTRSTHMASIVHQLHSCNNRSRTSFNNYHLPESNVGFQLMLKDGWNRDNGLGPRGTGVKYPPKTVLKTDRNGFGSQTKQKARITHFGSNDTNAVKSRKEDHHKPRSIRKYERRLREERERYNEIKFRREWNTLEL